MRAFRPQKFRQFVLFNFLDVENVPNSVASHGQRIGNELAMTPPEQGFRTRVNRRRFL